MLSRLAHFKPRRIYSLETTTLTIRNSFGITTTFGGSSSRRNFSRSLHKQSDNMGVEDAFREMEANGVPKQGQPTCAAAPKQEEQKELPKLSAAEFRVYNRMAEHMDMFVSSAQHTKPCVPFPNR